MPARTIRNKAKARARTAVATATRPRVNPKASTGFQLPDEFLHAKESAAAQLLTVSPKRPLFRAFAASPDPRHNVVGIGVGRKITTGKLTSALSIRIYVERKIPRQAINPDLLLPDKIEGIPTDVVETGRFRARSIETSRRRPAQPGCSIGFQFTGPMAGTVMAGTLGAIVSAKGARYLLSNNHVLADENGLPIGSPIYQPGLLDGGRVPNDEIAHLTKFVRLGKSGANHVDAAIAEVGDRKAVRASFLPKVGKLLSNLPDAASEGMRVHKVGRTTGYTTGSIFDTNADVVVEYDMGEVRFADQMLIVGDHGAFSDAGDSGSAIINRATGRAVGLLFAGSNTHTIANHLVEVLAKLKVELVV